MLFSQIIPPSLSPTESKRLFIHLCNFCYLAYRVNMFAFKNKKLPVSCIKPGLAIRFLYDIQEAWGWCTGMTQRDGMRREVGEGIRIGNTCTPMADSC